MSSWRKSPWWAAGGAVVPAGLMLYGVSVPGGYQGFLVAAMCGWVVVWLAWAVFGWAWWSVDSPEARWRLWPLAVVPVVFVASWWVASGDLVGRAVFAHYRTDLEQFADHRGATHDGIGVGPYSFDFLDRGQGCVLYGLHEPGMARASGFAWCPGTAPPETYWGEGEVFEKLDGDWYVFLIRHGRFEDRGTGADPWGLQITELRVRGTPHV
ncbi:hypothetical protein ACTMTJ_34520 [Phytohabitans sp. LJ34]|uniref:hypothetical protein n=1 Tax=Phytohabitans sp. LJ34 TaxID=3452217 RepID=UPI003F8BEBE2